MERKRAFGTMAECTARLSLLVLSLLGTGCRGEQEQSAQAPGGQSAAVEVHDLGQSFAPAFVPPPPLSGTEPLAALRDRLQRFSFPIQATGAILMPFRDAAGVPLFRDGSAVRGSCGATLISPSYAITAAHCVAKALVFQPETDLVTLQLFRPTRKLGEPEVWLPKTQLTGTFPDYQHATYGESDGYFVDNYPCKLISRCGDGFNCPAEAGSADIALLFCPDRPGDRYGHLGVAESDTPLAQVFVPWKHEVYDIAENLPVGSDLYTHYVKYPASYADNYHYLDRHQLLPLISTPWPDGSARRKTSSTTGSDTWTDVLACHGTSGSGFLQQRSTGEWELLGPTTLGGSALGGLLCQHLPGLNGKPSPAPGGQHIAYGSLHATRRFLDALPAWKSECASQPQGTFSLGGRMPCQRVQSGLPLTPRFAYSDLDPWTSPTLLVTDGAVELGKVVLEQGQTYRLTVSVAPSQGCSTGTGESGSCPEVAVRVGNDELLRSSLEASAGKSLTVGSMFTAGEAGALTVSFEAHGAAMELGELSIVPNEYHNGFDTAHERAEAALMVPEVDAQASLPMRFSGDGKEGFLALLHPGERLVLSHAGVAARGRYELRFSASRVNDMRCGLLARDGSVLLAVACSPLAPTSLEYQGVDAAVALFVDGPADEATEIDDLDVVFQAGTTGSPCEDRVQNGDETDVDCGGSCKPCGDTKKCESGEDCLSAWCSDGLCSCHRASCAEQGKSCGSVPDGCGGSLPCGECAPPSTCGGTGLPNVCGCAAESDAAFCARLGKACGTVVGVDDCGVTRTVSSCGTCAAPSICAGAGTPNQCGKPCMPESDSTFCTRLGKVCGTVTASDNCGAARTVSSCGTCSAPNTCGGGGTANQCGQPCIPESDLALCTRLGKTCGRLTATDTCGSLRVVSSCGTCTAPDSCGDGGTANMCGRPLPSCAPRYAQGDCLTYLLGTKVSVSGRNWQCSNGNCANCAGFSSCAPGGNGCPWGVVWTDQGPCR